MKSVPSSSWRALLSLFRIRGALVDPRPCRLQGKTDIFVSTIHMEEIRQHFACGESEDLTCDHFYSTSPPRETIGRETVWGVVWGDIRVVHFLHYLRNEQGITEADTAADHHLGRKTRNWMFKQHLVLCQHVSVKEQKEDKEGLAPAEERRQADLMRPHDSPSNMCHSSQDTNRMMSLDQLL